MGLKDLRLPEEVITTPGGDLRLRGISLLDIADLGRHHADALGALYTQFVTDKSVAMEDAGFKMGTVIGVVMKEAPGVAAEIIALAAGDRDVESVEIAGRLPFTVQIEALEAIGRLTFTTDDAIKKVIETVTRMFEGISGTVKELQAPSTIGDETFADS